MTYHSDHHNGPRDTLFRPAGPGVIVRFRCMGCNQSRQTTGARGVGVRKRCAVCLTPSEPKK